MKKAQEIEKDLPEPLRGRLDFDKREIDNPDPHDPVRLNYMDRLKKVLSVIGKNFPNPQGVSIADIGCAQGNLSILLAEKGYSVTAVDIDPLCLEYAKRKLERGSVRWMQGSFDRLNLDAAYDIIILGELIEHCAYPEDFVRKAVSCLKPSGIAIITTPNGSMLANRLPSFGSLRKREDRKFLEEKQFGHDGASHLFLFALSDIKLILPENAALEESGYLGGSVLINRRTAWLLRWLPAGIAEGIERLLALLPLLNRYTCHCIYVVMRKE